MRRIVSVQMHAAGRTGEAPDGFFDRIIKYIPADVVAGWVAVDGLTGGLNAGMLWGLLVVFAALALLWTKKQTDVPGQPPAWRQSVIAAVSFLVWAFALQSGPL